MSDEIIRIEDLNKTFTGANGTVVALDGVNLSIKRGEIFGIIGLSGAGKSTLVRCINFLEKPTSGRVIFEGNDLSQLKTRELLLARQSMGMIFQSFNLLSQRNALQNICFPMEIAGVPKAEAKKRAAELLQLVGLSDRAKAYPSQMSGGQKQRIAIARALSTNPSVLLCDEATSALDPNTTRQILDLLKDNGYDENTVVVITSDHGEEFNDNGDNFWGHNSNFTNAQIKIPLIIKWPGKGHGSVDMTTSAYDLTATILPEVFGVTNPISDFSIGQNLFNLKPVDYVLCGSYLENAIVEKDRIVLIDELGMLRFKDKHYNDTDNTARDAYLLDAVRTFSEYLGDK